MNCPGRGSPCAFGNVRERSPRVVSSRAPARRCADRAAGMTGRQDERPALPVWVRAVRPRLLLQPPRQNMSFNDLFKQGGAEKHVDTPAQAEARAKAAADVKAKAEAKAARAAAQRAGKKSEQPATK